MVYTHHSDFIKLDDKILTESLGFLALYDFNHNLFRNI